MLSGAPPADPEGMVRDYDNQRVLREAVVEMQEHLKGQAQDSEG
jgi:phosphopantothenate synthetase